jgi:hypothetical protein
MKFIGVQQNPGFSDKIVHKRRAHVFGSFHAWILCCLLNFCDPCSRVCEEQINICSEIAQNRLSV